MGRRRRGGRARDDDLPVVTPRHHGTLIPAVDGDVLHEVSVGPAGQAVVLWSTAAGHEALRGHTTGAGGASFPDAAPRRPVPVRVTFHDQELAGVVTIPDLRLAHPMVQPLPAGRVLVVGARCDWRPDGPDRNGAVYDEAGALVAEGTLGDGIEHVLTSPAGNIWVGYFDEGVYGNYGWGGSGPEPIGASGIACFTSDLQVAWRYDGAVPIDDCYALNVAGETAWACVYSGFPVLRMDAGVVTSWHNQVRGARALLVDGSTVALVGGYPPDRDRIVVGTLTGDGLEIRRRARLHLPDGSDPRTTTLVARGSELHVISGRPWLKGREWMKLGLDELTG